MKFINQFKCNDDDSSHIQFEHIDINNDNFQKKIIKYIFEDKLLYKYVTNYSAERMKTIESEYPLNQLINLLKNLKKEYISEFITEDIQKKLCKKMNKKIDTRRKDWKEYFDAFLNDRINGYDVIAEIILSKILEEYLEADVLVTKLGLTTNTNMKVFGIDVLHYNTEKNLLIFGESKFTNTIDLGIEQHLDEIELLDYKLTCESKLFANFENNIRGIDEIKYKFSNFGRKLTLTSINSLEQTKTPFNIGVAFFISHGDVYDYKIISKKIKKIKNKIKIKNIQIYLITLPVKSKADFIDVIKEVIKEYEQ